MDMTASMERFFEVIVDFDSMTGHALGAAGAIEAAIAWLTVAGDGRLPVHHFDGERDAELPAIALVAPGHPSTAGR